MEEDKKNSLLKSTMNYGVILGLSLVIYSLFIWMLGETTNKNLSFVTYIIMISGIIISTKTFRDQEQGGYITYGRGLAVGTLTCFFAGIITSFFTFLLYTVIDPGLIDRTYALMENAYYESGMNDNQVETALNLAKKFTNPFTMMVFGFIGSVFMGFVFSLITSVFLKKEENPFESDTL